MPREPLAWVGFALAALAFLALAPALFLLLLSGWRRMRLSQNYSPLPGWRARWVILLALPLLAAGLAILWFGMALEGYDPVRRGEPVGLVWVQEGEVVYLSAFDQEVRALAPWQGKPFTVLGDTLYFPSWARWIGLHEAYHSARSTWRPAAVLDRPPPPEGDPLFRLVAATWFPGEARSHISPTMSGRRKMSLFLLPEAGYATSPYPSGGR